jgi:hypothetical protein
MLRVSSHHGDEGEGEENGNEEDFAAGEPEFGLTVRLDGENVQETESPHV